MKDKVLRLIERHISAAEDDSRLIKWKLRHRSGPELDRKYRYSDKTCREMLAESEQALKEAHDMKAWFLGVVGEKS